MDKQFYHYLYTRNRISQMIKDYCNQHLKVPDPVKRVKLRKLLEYYNLLTDGRFLIGNGQSEGNLIILLKQITKIIKTHFKSIDYELTIRIKDLFSTWGKLDLVEDKAYTQVKTEFIEQMVHNPNLKGESSNLEEKIQNDLLDDKGTNQTKADFANWLKNYDFNSTNNPFNRIRDFLAFRIIIEDSGNGDNIPELYQIANLIIELVDQKTTFDIIPAASLVNNGPLNNASPLVIVPKSEIKKEYATLIKDYVASPKSDGYQSIHIVFFDPYTGQYVELQLCTRSMRIIAETDASHEKHKKRRYGTKIEVSKKAVDFSKIKLDNNQFRFYKTLSEEQGYYIYDNAGLTKPFVFDLYTIDKLKKFLSTW